MLSGLYEIVLKFDLGVACTVSILLSLDQTNTTGSNYECSATVVQYCTLLNGATTANFLPEFYHTTHVFISSYTITTDRQRS
jgi:hypothetical protein